MLPKVLNISFKVLKNIFAIHVAERAKTNASRKVASTQPPISQAVSLSVSQSVNVSGYGYGRGKTFSVSCIPWLGVAAASKLCQ